jgi:crotonobetainyl-CoA:carnitine CoA-transferase CaiB-like acyl-CoA transferase
MTDVGDLTGLRGQLEQDRPLDGLRVLEFGSLIAGPFGTRIMAEFGAEVIKPRGRGREIP